MFLRYLAIVNFILLYKLYVVNMQKEKKTNRHIPQESITRFAIKMLIKMLLHATFISLKFTVIVHEIVPPKPKCIHCLSCILFVAIITFSQIGQAFILTVKFMIYLKSSTSDSSRKGICFCNIRTGFTFAFFTVLPNIRNLALTK